MAYIDKNNCISLCNSIHLGYIKNKDGKTTNPYLFIHTTMNLNTNQVTNTMYSVQAFENKETIGYHRSKHDNYADAKKEYDKLFNYHIETK
jgi:hypothetical protein